MSINLTQEFVFETDEIESFSKMLEAIVSILFSPNGKHSQLHLKTKQPFGLDDGKEYYSWWRQQKPILTYQNKTMLLNADGCYHGAALYTVEQEFNNIDAAAAASEKDFKKIPLPKPMRMWVTTLSDYQENKKVEKNCKNFEDLINLTVSKLKTVDEKKFYQECGDGFHQGFNRDDGSVKFGYRMQQRSVGGCNHLDISLVHVYYGK